MGKGACLKVDFRKQGEGFRMIKRVSSLKEKIKKGNKKIIDKF